MKTNIKDTVTAIGFMAALVLALLMNIILPDKEVSEAERRILEQKPELTVQSVLAGDYFEELEDYALDQFLLRDPLRTIKSAVRLGVFGQLESNDLFIRDGGIFKLSPQLNESAVEVNCGKLVSAAQSILPDADMYYAVIPEKNAGLAGGVYPEFDRDRFGAVVERSMMRVQKIDISDLLTIDDYYLTDPHWKQECISDVADRILVMMGSPAIPEGELNVQSAASFFGTYHGQLPLNVDMDKLCYMTSHKISSATAHNYETGRTGSVYNEEKLSAMDPYDFYLDGACALIRIENPSGVEGRELVMFRDSFGSSIAPLLLGDYSAVTLVDLRYMSSTLLNQYITPAQDTDVLFLYSETILNNNGVFR